MKRTVLFLLYLFFSIQSWSQSYLPMELIDEVDGLSFRDVKQVYQDKEGFLWFCTANGLNRYDGVEWKVYKHIPGDTTSIATNVINWIYEDSDGNFIIDNSDRAPLYSFYNRKTEKFRKIKVLNYHLKNALAIRGPFITKSGEIIGVGKIARPNISYKSPDENPKALLLNYLGNGVFEASDELSFSMATPPYSELLSSTSERFWSLGFGKHEMLDLDKKTLTRYLSSDFGNYELPIDKKGKFWYPDLREGSKQLFRSFQLPVNIPLEDWYIFRFDNMGNIWLKEKQKKRIFKYDVHLKSLNESGEFGMNYFSLRSILEDRNGTIWTVSYTHLTLPTIYSV